MKDRLRKIRKELKLTQTEFGTALGKTMRTVQDYEAGKRNITLSLALELQKKFNVNSDWLITGSGAMFLSSSPEKNIPSVHSRGVCVRFYPEVKASAGGGFPVFDETAEEMWLDESIVRNVRTEVVISVRGDSMLPFLQDRDKILIDTDLCALYPLRRGVVYIISAPDGLFIKRFNRRRGTCGVFSSDNIDFSDIEVELSAESSARVVGILRSIVYRLLQPYKEEEEDETAES